MDGRANCNGDSKSDESHQLAGEELVNFSSSEGSESDTDDECAQQTLTLNEILQKGLFNPYSGLFHDPVSGNNFSLGAAIKHGLIDAKKSVFKLPQTGEMVDLQEAIQSGAVNSKSGNVYDYVKGEEIPLHIAVRRNLVSEDSQIASNKDLIQHVVSNSIPVTQDRVRSGRLSLQGTPASDGLENFLCIRDKKGGNLISFNEARKNSLVKFIESDIQSTRVGMKGCFVKDTLKDKWLSWDKACDAGLVNSKHHVAFDSLITRRDSKQSKRVTWSMEKKDEVATIYEENKILDGDTAAQEFPTTRNKRKQSIELCSMSDIPVTLDDVIDNGLYDSVTNTVRDVNTDECVPFAEAIERGLVHKASLLRDPVSKDILTLEEAIDKRIIDPLSGRMMLSSGLPIALTFAVQRDLVVKCKVPFCLSLSEIIEEGLFDSSLGMMIHPDTEEKITFSQAIFSGMLDTSAIRIRDVQSGKVFDFQDAVTHDLINMATGKCYDTSSGDSLSMIESIERGILIDMTNQPKYNLLEVLDDCLVDSFGMFTDMSTGYNVTLQNAMDSGLFDRDCALVRELTTSTLLTLDGALREGIINPNTGVYTDGSKTYDFNTAISKGLIVQNLGSTDLNLIDSIHEGVYISSLQKFMDPRNGELKTMFDALDTSLIKCDDIVLKDNKNNKFVPFVEGMSTGLINMIECQVLDTKECVCLDLKDALNMGFIRQKITTSPIGLVAAVTSGIYDTDLQRLRDKVSQMCVDIEDAIDLSVIDSSTTYVRDSARNQFIPLQEAVALHLMDRYSGKVTDTRSFEKVTLDKAVKEKLIIDMPTTGFYLVDIVEVGLFDKMKRTIMHPKSCAQLILKDALAINLVNGNEPQVLVPERGIFTPIEAVKEGILDSITCEYLGELSLLEAIDKGFIFKSHTEGFQPFLSAVADILRDTDITSLTSAKQILDAGFTGHSDFARKSNYGKPLFGIQRSVEEGIFDKHRCMFYDLRIKSSVTLNEALKTGLLHGTRSRIMNPATEIFMSLVDAADKGIVSGKTGSLLDRKNMKSIPLERAVDENLAVDVPFSKVTLDEAVYYGLLDTYTLKFQSIVSDERTTLVDAIYRAFIDSEETLVKDPDNETVMTLRKAVDCGLFNTTTACIVCSRIIHLKDALKEGYIFNRRSPGNQSKLLKQKLIKQNIPDDKINGDISQYLSKHSSDSSGIGMPQLSSSGSEGVCNNLVEDSNDIGILTFKEALEKGLINSNTGEISIPGSKGPTSILDAIKNGDLDVSTVTFRDQITDVDLTFTMAIDKGLLTMTNGTKQHIGISFKEALENDLIYERKHMDQTDGLSLDKDSKNSIETLSTGKVLEWQQQKPCNLSSSLDSLLQTVRDDKGTYRLGTLYRLLHRDLYNCNTGKLTDTLTGQSMSLQEAIQGCLINIMATEIRDMESDSIISLQEAVNMGLVDTELGTYLDALNDKVMSLKEAYTFGFIVESVQTTRDVRSSVEIYIDEVLCNEKNKGKAKIQEAFSSGVLHRSNSQVIDPDTIQPITLRRAASLGLIDMSSGEFKNPQSGDTMPLTDAVEKGFILSPKGLTLYSAVNQGLYDGKICQFVDPATGKEHSLREMIDMEIVTPLCMEIRDLTREGVVVTLQSAIAKKIIEDEKSVYVNLVDNNVYNFFDAIAAGLIVSSSPREGLRESNNSQNVLSAHGVQSIEQARFRQLAELQSGPVLMRPFPMGGRSSRNSSSSDLTTDSSSSDRKDAHWILPYTSDMIRQMIYSAKQKRENAHNQNQEKVSDKSDTEDIDVDDTPIETKNEIDETSSNIDVGENSDPHNQMNGKKESFELPLSTKYLVDPCSPKSPVSPQKPRLSWQQELKVKPAFEGLRKVGKTRA